MRVLVLVAVIMMIGVAGVAQPTLWRYGTARTLPVGQQEFGIIHPFQIGATERLEISAQPLLGLTLAPNISFKANWYRDQWAISTRHAFAMPTALVHSLVYPPWQDLARSEHETPFLLNFRNEGLATRQIGKEMLITARVGFEFTLKAWGDSILPLPTERWLWMRTTTLNGKLLWYGGAQYDLNIYKDFNGMADLFFYSSGLLNDWAIEHKGYFIWNKSNKFAAMIGYKAGFGTYPEPTLTQPRTPRFFILPVADLIWKLNVKREPQKDLFRVR